MIYKTVGAAGDYASWKEAWDSLAAAGPLSDDYEFRQISDCTINNNWPVTQVNINGKSIRFYVEWADSHQGDPTKGYVTYVNGNAGFLRLQTTAASLPGIITVENLYIRQTTTSNIELLRVGVGGNLDTLVVYQKNLLIRGNSVNVGRGVSWIGNRIEVYISNCKIWNIRDPFWGSFISTVPGDDMTGKHIAENITIGQHASTSAFWLPNTLGMEWILRNSVATGGAPPFRDYYGQPGYKHQVYNCAGSDGTLTTSNYLIKQNIIDNIVDTDQFDSVLDTDSTFWFLPLGSFGVGFYRRPSGNLLVNQECKFTPEVTITPGSSELGENGTTSTLQNTDIAGESRPGADGFYAIGAHEQQY